MDLAQALYELRIAPDASEEKIRKAHRELSQKWHPDHDGDDDVMQRLNQARDVALEHAKLMAEAPGQAIVLRKVLDLEKRREEREDNREKGRELVAGAATVQIGRLRRTQRKASNLAIFTAALAAALGVLKLASPLGGSFVDFYLLCFAVAAIVGGVYRTILAERIGQMQLAIEDVGATLASRSAFAGTFREISAEVLDMGEFEEEDLRLATRLWLSPRAGHIRFGKVEEEEILPDGLADDALGHPTGSDEPMILLRDIMRCSRIDGKSHLRVADTFAFWIEIGDLRCYRSAKGLCVARADIAEMTAGRSSDDLWALVAETHVGSRPPASLGQSPAAFTRAVLRRFWPAGYRDNDDPESKLRLLADRIGVVDGTRVIIGKGLENRLLGEREIQDRNGDLITLYSFTVSPTGGRLAQ